MFNFHRIQLKFIQGLVIKCYKKCKQFIYKYNNCNHASSQEERRTS